MILGSAITGIDTNTNKPVTGIVLDKVIVPQMISIQQPRQIGNGQALPMALSAYLVLDPSADTIHLVQPNTITKIKLKEDESINQTD